MDKPEKQKCYCERSEQSYKNNYLHTKSMKNLTGCQSCFIIIQTYAMNVKEDCYGKE